MTNYVTETGRRLRPDEIVVVHGPGLPEAGIQLDAFGNVTNQRGDGVTGVTDEQRREAALESSEGITFESGEYVIWAPEQAGQWKGNDYLARSDI